MVYNDDAHKRIFLFSANDRDGLTAKIKTLGFGVIAARRSQNLLSRFIGSATSIAVIDLRGVGRDAFDEIKELGNFIKINGFSLITAIDIDDEEMIATSHEINATHIISINGVDSYWRLHLEMALELVQRLQGNGSSHILDERQSRSMNYSWMFNIRTFDFEAGDSIKHAINQSYSKAIRSHYDSLYPKSQLLRFLTQYQRTMAIAAYRRLNNGDDQTAFPHEIWGRNFIHHIELDGDIVRGYMEEVSEVKAWRSRDLLTGVRSGSFARNHLLSWDHSVDGDLSLIMIGLRQLESINTRFGRSQGNAIIQQAGERVSTALSDDINKDYIVARVAGKEFLILCSGTISLSELRLLTENIMSSLSQPYEINKENFHISARASICTLEENDNGMAALRRANLSLSEVMRHPSMTIAIAQSSQNDHPQYDENIERELRVAIEQNQIEVVLQPQFDIKNGQMIGAEALARWNHPNLGKLGANILFSVADRCDYRDKISRHIQNLSLEICAKWPDALCGVRLSLNVTPQQMSSERFADEFIETIDKSGFDLNRLTIELTEENLIENIDLAGLSLLKLRNKGIKIAIDDFGTGYSSLAYITELPLDYLKLDKALIRNILRSNKDLMVLRSIIALGRAVGLSVIAEGVETQDILALLRKEKCDIYQGYFGSKPLSIAQFEKFALRNI